MTPNDTPSEQLPRRVLDDAAVLAFELCGYGTDVTDVVHSAAAALDVDVDALWDHLDAGVELWADLARKPGVPVRLLERWAASDDMVVATHAASNRTAPPALLAKVVDRWDGERPARAAAANPAAGSALLARLARSTDPSTRRWVARNTSTSSRTLTRLAADTSTEVVAGVASHDSTSAAPLARLAHHDALAVRIVFARHPRTPRTALVHLANTDPQEGVRIAAKTSLGG